MCKCNVASINRWLVVSNIAADRRRFTHGIKGDLTQKKLKGRTNGANKLQSERVSKNEYCAAPMQILDPAENGT
jgi:hypothetical protein